MKTSSDVTYFEHYARYNDLTSSGRQVHWRFYRKVFRPLLPANRDARILDFGCGAGILLEWLRSEGYTSAEGVDRDKGQVEFAHMLGLAAEVAEDSAAWLRQAGQFDMIFMTDVLEHIPTGHDLPLLSDINSALKPGGCAVFKVPNANAAFGPRSLFLDPTHQRLYTETSLRHDLERCGFQQIEIMSDDDWSAKHPKELLAIPVRFFFRTMRHLEAISEFGIAAKDWILSPNLVAVGRKIS